MNTLQAINSVPFLSKSIRWFWYNRFLFRKPKRTSWGFDMIGEDSMLNGCYESEVEELLKQLLSETDVCINAGANIGYYSLLARYFGKQVVAIEPMPANLKILYRNLKLNGFNDVEVFPMALADRAGIADIYGGGTGSSIKRGWAGVPDYVASVLPVTTLDIVTGNRFQGKRVLVLADIEGAEYQMMQHASCLLYADPKPVWIVEIVGMALHNQGGVNPDFLNTFRIFWNAGYRSFDLKMQEIHLSDLEAGLQSGQNMGGNYLFKE